MRTLFLNHAGVMGGAEFCLLDAAKSLRESATVVLLQDGPFRHALERNGVEVRVVDAEGIHAVRRDSTRPGVGVLRALWRAGREVAALAAGYDVIHANSQKALIVGSIAAIRARKPLVWHLHDIIEPPWFSRLNIAVDVFLANRVADRVLTPSRATADALVRQGGRADKVHVVYNAIDASAFRSLPERGSLRELLRSGDAPLVGCFSRLAEWKGQHVLIAAMTHVPGAHVVLVGGALFGEERYEARLRALCDSLGLTDRVHFLGQRPDVATLMHDVDFVVHPSTAPEPFARTLVEAMLMGHAPIASACGGIPEIVTNGEHGFLVTPGDAIELASILRELVADPARVRAVGDRARAYAQQRFAIHHFTDGVTRHLRAAANRPDSLPLREVPA